MKKKFIITFLILILFLVFGFIIYSHTDNYAQKQILKQLEKNDFIFGEMKSLKIINKNNITKEYIYKNNEYYYFFQIIRNNKNYDIYIYLEKNDNTPIMPTHLDYTDNNSSYIHLSATNNSFIPNYKLITKKVVPKN